MFRYQGGGDLPAMQRGSHTGADTWAIQSDAARGSFGAIEIEGNDLCSTRGKVRGDGDPRERSEYSVVGQFEN